MLVNFPLVSGFTGVTMFTTDDDTGRWQRYILMGFLLAVALSGSMLGQSSAANPILPGDHPDPTIVRIGKTYWTTSTSGDWAPEFPLYHSTDLQTWTAAGAVFPKTPAWASGSFWAPEMVFDEGRVLVYYVARKRDGPLCVAVATASHAEGPYTDHGPMLCEPDGSIDPSFVRDEHGQPFLIWKEDANSERKPTPIWAQPLTPDLLHLTGTKTMLLVNEPASWEGDVVEGPYVMRHAGRFFMFYAGGACCGSACHYAEGAARADHLLGPWEKDPANPIIHANTAWKCPGHGTAVQTTAGKDYFLYHAYPAVGTVYLGRESVLDAIDWSPAGWPVVNAGSGPGGGVLPGGPVARQQPFTDEFRHATLDPEWKWPIGHAPVVHVGNGQLMLAMAGDEASVFVGRSLMAPAYVATVGVDASGGAGLGIIGDTQNQLVLTTHGTQLELARITKGGSQVLWQTELGGASKVWLRISSAGTADAASFSYSLDQKQWIEAKDAVSLAGLPPWDQGLRIGLVSQGSQAKFVHFTLTAGRD
jgi:xylan 1,4-beta-xylosidase